MRSLFVSVISLQWSLSLISNIISPCTLAFSIVPPSPIRSSAQLNASTSPLFRSVEKYGRHTKARTQSKMIKSLTELQMTEDSDNDAAGKDVQSSSEVTNDEKEVTSSTIPASPSKPGKERSGFFTALILGPPLIAKFGIVLLVKFATDLIVFPLLFLYRMCRLVKNKIVGIFRSSDDEMKGDKINGAGTPSS